MFSLEMIPSLKILSLGLDLAMKAVQLRENFSRARKSRADSDQNPPVNREEAKGSTQDPPVDREGIKNSTPIPRTDTMASSSKKLQSSQSSDLLPKSLEIQIQLPSVYTEGLQSLISSSVNALHRSLDLGVNQIIEKPEKSELCLIWKFTVEKISDKHLRRR